MASLIRPFVAIALGCFAGGASAGAQTSVDSIAVEVVAARHLLARHPFREVSLDSGFAMPGHAPGVPTAALRPARRHRALADSLALDSDHRAQIGIARITLSAPQFAGDSAMLTVTVSYDTGRRPRGGFYETELVTLRRARGTWYVQRSSQLGIT